MTTRELIDKITLLDPEGTREVWVRGIGGIPHGNIPVKDASVGFDWTCGQFILHPRDTMQRVPRKEPRQ